jgi:exonuclease VII large subunit
LSLGFIGNPEEVTLHANKMLPDGGFSISRLEGKSLTIATDAAGNVLRDAAQVGVGDAVNVQLHRGRLLAEIKSKKT